ncbi:hypothetical protein C1646_766634, partial [Rhizophagus diaphanus]
MTDAGKRIFHPSILCLDNISEKKYYGPILAFRVSLLRRPTLFHPEAEKDKTEGQVIRYSSKKYLSDIPTRNNIVAENDERLTAILEDALFNCQEIPFMATDNEGSSQKINGKYCYVLRLYGSLINGQKAIVTLLGIQVFFDVLVPDGETSNECEIKVRDILSGEVETQKIEHIKAFPFWGYHTEKKTYLRIYMSGTGKRKTAIKAVQDNNYETASDDLFSFHHKLGEFAEILNLKQNVFMICMTLHWKDNPKPLKQICLVNIKTEPDPRWTTINLSSQHSRMDLGADDRKKKERKKNSVNTDSENTFHILENGEEDMKVKEFLGGLTMIKISAEDNFFFSFLKLPECVPIDVRVCLKKRYSHSEVEKEGSLKFFLQKCGLDAKVNMPYDKMWKIYSEAKKSPSSSTVRKMREVAYYCIIDALRCQELLVKLSQINEYREVASIAYISLFDSHYRANELKVQNLLGAYAFKRDMLFSARIPEKVEKG